MPGIGIFGGNLVRSGSVLNQIDEALLDDGTFLVTDEEFFIVEEDNIESFIISED